MAVEGGRDGIPVRLSSIRTQAALPGDPSRSGCDDLPTPAVGGWVRLAAAVRRLGRTSKGAGEENRAVRSRKGYRKARKITQWFGSYFARKNHRKAFHSKVQELDLVMPDEKNILGTKGIDLGSLKRVTLEHCYPRRALKSQKSFSHELGPRGGTRPTHVRTYSYGDLKESPLSKFDAAKELMNAKLAAFNVLEKDLLSREQGTTGSLQIAQKCIAMTSTQFREECERIIKNLDETRQQCQSDSNKQLLTRLLLILTPCSRLLQFQKDGEFMSEQSLDRFKYCLDNLPAADKRRNGEPAMEENSLTKYQLNKNEILHSSQNPENHNHECVDTVSPKSDDIFKDEMVHEGSLASLHEQDEHHERADTIICRICEENIPASHWKFHIYICACADQCDTENLEIDQRLIRIAELLEQIVQFYNQTCLVSCSASEMSKMQSTNSENGPESCSLEAQEEYNEGIEGMLEEIHEMDTACLNDHHISSYTNLKKILAKKLGNCLPASSNETTAPSSCTNTPSSNYFDSSWFEDSNLSEHEDANQMNDMVDIARKAANMDPRNKNAFELLNVCLLDLDNILQCRELKDLIIDTFGNRLKHLLEEKFVLVTHLLDKERERSNIQHEENRGTTMVNTSNLSESTANSPLLKERTSIDDFDIMKPISRGAFGQVFLARKRTTKDLFAIKVLKKLHMLRKNDIDRILAERDILIKVRNPFVVRFFYSFISRDNLYLVMEYLNGGDLYSLLRKVGCLEEDAACTYTAELVLALEYLHSLGIIHRVLKPDNILIAQDGHIKLTGFGLSKIGLMDNAMNLSGSEVTGSSPLDTKSTPVFCAPARQRLKRSRCSAVGTPDYLAPEILLGATHDYSADWWSVGIILFELIAGIPPFTDKFPEIFCRNLNFETYSILFGTVMIFNNILNGNIPWPRVPEDMSYEARDIIERLLTHDQNLRLGAEGASEVKAHLFFRKIDWENLSLHKAAFIPQPDSEDDTSYFAPRYTKTSSQDTIENNSSDFTSEATRSRSIPVVEPNVQSCAESKQSDACISLDPALLNFSFKNRSELASITYDVLLQSGRS